MRASRLTFNERVTSLAYSPDMDRKESLELYQRFVLCSICSKPHAADDLRCLDCHGELKLIDPYILRCAKCHVKHSSAFGKLSRSGTLIHMNRGKGKSYARHCVLSKRLLK